MIYLDNAATSFPKPHCVEKAITYFLTSVGANPGRSGNSLSTLSGKILYDCRKALSHFIGQENLLKTIFTANATHAINTCLYGLLKQGDIVVTTGLEHNSVIRPLQELSHTRNIQIRFIPTNTDCTLDLKMAKEILKGAKLLVCTHANNVTGAVLPIDKLVELAHEENVLFLLDASQSIGSIPINIEKQKIDILCASGHKGLFGPMGTGFFSISKNIHLETFSSFLQGGTGSRSEDMLQPSFLPDKFESGTPNMHGIAGLLAGIKWINKTGLDAIHHHELELRKHLIEGLNCINAIKIIEVTKHYPTTSTLSIFTKHLDIAKVAQQLDQSFGIISRVGLHCSPLTHSSIETISHGGTIRLSPGIFTTHDDIDYVIKALKEITK